ncbi:MAG: DUF3179 domain-containing protein [Chloroflexi bacterium]|nr:DUF3179 domain-containing protein [Chloroflexota bacterium]
MERRENRKVALTDLQRKQRCAPHAVYGPDVDHVKRTFRKDKKDFVDDQTGTRWDLLGTAAPGSLPSRRLRPLVNWSGQFWLSWAVFKPDTAQYRGSGVWG